MLRADKFVTLFYLDDKIHYRPEHYNDGHWQAAWYYAVQQMPIIEFLGTNPVEIVEEMLQLTTTGEWQSQQRRSMRCGDIVCVGYEPRLLIPKSDMPNRDSTNLTVWPDYAVTVLEDNVLKELLCN